MLVLVSAALVKKKKVCLLNWFRLLGICELPVPFRLKLGVIQNQSHYLFSSEFAHLSLSVFFFFRWLPLCPSLYLALCSSKKVCSSLQRTTWCFWQKVSNREETRCTLKNVILTLPYHGLKTHTHAHTMTPTHTHMHVHTHTHTHINEHTLIRFLAHTLAHTKHSYTHICEDILLTCFIVWI